MPTDTEKKLRSLYEQLIAKEKIEIHLKNIDRLLIMKEEALVIAQSTLEKEEMDVAKLERESLYTIFKTILGTKEQELERERQEYLQAFLKKQSIDACILEIKKEKELLLHSFSGKFNVEKEFDRLLEKQKGILRATQSDLAEDIIVFEERIARHLSRVVELRQAVKAGKRLVKILESIIASFERIKEWGNGYAVSAVQKRYTEGGRIKRKVTDVQKYLQRFENELFDLSDHYGHDYRNQIVEIKKFIDLFIDSLITDWVVKNKIEHSKSLILNLIDKVNRIIAMVENDIKKTKGYIAQEKKDQRDLIVKKSV